MPARVYVGSAVLLLVGNGQAQMITRLWITWREYGIDRMVVHKSSIMSSASLGRRQGRLCERRAAAAMTDQNNSSEDS